MPNFSASPELSIYKFMEFSLFENWTNIRGVMNLFLTSVVKTDNLFYNGPQVEKIKCLQTSLPLNLRNLSPTKFKCYRLFM